LQRAQPNARRSAGRHLSRLDDEFLGVGNYWPDRSHAPTPFITASAPPSLACYRRCLARARPGLGGLRPHSLTLPRPAFPLNQPSPDLTQGLGLLPYGPIVKSCSFVNTEPRSLSPWVWSFRNWITGHYAKKVFRLTFIHQYRQNYETMMHVRVLRDRFSMVRFRRVIGRFGYSRGAYAL
jgi:hypothetical protein